MAQLRESNPNWKGGRVVAHSGYVLIRVGVAHHLSDVRGYAYEHRLVAERNLGRRLRPGEEVHHVDGDRSNNAPENIEVMVDRLAHAVHRRKRTDLRLRDEANDLVECACGCGIYFTKFDSSGRPRRFIAGHNLRSIKNG